MTEAQMNQLKEQSKKVDVARRANDRANASLEAAIKKARDRAEGKIEETAAALDNELAVLNDMVAAFKNGEVYGEVEDAEEVSA